MTLVKVIDAHLHLSPQVSADARVAAARLDRDLAAANVQRAIVLHLEAQPWTIEEFAEAIAFHPRLSGFVNINPLDADAADRLRLSVEKLGFIGLKLHPRLQAFDLEDPAVTKLIAQAGEIGIPVLIDAFPDGDWLMMGFDPLAFARVAKASPRTRIIVAHFGGHRCIDFMMLAKRIPNLWFDLSYSLLYYANSPVTGNLMYCCRSLNYRRVFFGSDYPDRPIGLGLDMSMKIFADHNVEGEHLEALLWRNAADFFGWTKD